MKVISGEKENPPTTICASENLSVSNHGTSAHQRRITLIEICAKELLTEDPFWKSSRPTPDETFGTTTLHLRSPLGRSHGIPSVGADGDSGAVSRVNGLDIFDVTASVLRRGQKSSALQTKLLTRDL